MFAKSFALASIVSITLAGSIPHIQSRSTLPDVTIKALPAGCASYPGYNADSQTAGPWSMIVSDAENPDLLRFGPSTSYSLSIGSQGPVMRWGYVRNICVNAHKAGVLTCRCRSISATALELHETHSSASTTSSTSSPTPKLMLPVPPEMQNGLLPLCLPTRTMQV
jgi:hypothetical protein